MVYRKGEIVDLGNGSVFEKDTVYNYFSACNSYLIVYLQEYVQAARVVV